MSRDTQISWFLIVIHLYRNIVEKQIVPYVYVFGY